MKTLFFNGCSFVAGDEIVWEQYCIEKGRTGLGWHDFLNKMSDSDNDFWNNYRYSYRMKNNLPAMVAKKLNSNHEDIAIDGNSNDKIAFSTVNYFLNINPAERKNYHACIGWTTTSRLMKFSKLSNSYFNLHINHIGAKTNPILQELNDYLMVALGQSHDEDFFMNFMKNIIMLENFFIANEMTYTFYKSLGTPDDTAPKNYVALSPPYVGHILTDKITNHDNWMRFDDEHLPYMGHSWCSAILQKHEHLYVSKTNGHPNLGAAEAMSEMIKNKIISQQVGFN